MRVNARHFVILGPAESRPHDAGEGCVVEDIAEGAEKRGAIDPEGGSHAADIQAPRLLAIDQDQRPRKIGFVSGKQCLYSAGMSNDAKTAREQPEAAQASQHRQGAAGMRVLITGAAGVLGRAITRLLARDPDVDLRLTDAVPMQTPHVFHQADLTTPEDLKPICEGVDVLLHVAAIHPWKPYTVGQYTRCNIEGTYNILHAAIAGGVRRVIYTSSVAAMGMAPNPACPLPWDESVSPGFPVGDIYGFSKHAGEEACRAFARQGRFTYLALRPGMFIPMPEDDVRFGLGLLQYSVHAEDVAMAHLLALRSQVVDEAIIVASQTSFSREDGPALSGDAASAILRHHPRARSLVEQGETLPSSIQCTYDIGKAKRLLGYEPKHTFDSWLTRRFGDAA